MKRTKTNNKSTRLPRNFHKTFIPERYYIQAMLRYAALGQEGDYRQIASATGIPTGISSGKVPAILDYCRGMGLLRLVNTGRSAIKKPELTNFGRIVLLEDPHLKEGVSQWIAHFNLCSPLSGADAWYQTFFAGAQALGMVFPRVKLEEHLSLIYGVNKNGIIGPLVRMYEDDASFRICGALSETAAVISRRIAPLLNEYGFAYGAWILQLIADHFPKAGQITVTELDKIAGWRTIPGWDIVNIQHALDLVERKGLIEVDRHMEPWLLRPKMTVDEAWKLIYEDLI